MATIIHRNLKEDQLSSFTISIFNGNANFTRTFRVGFLQNFSLVALISGRLCVIVVRDEYENEYEINIFLIDVNQNDHVKHVANPFAATKSRIKCTKNGSLIDELLVNSVLFEKSKDDVTTNGFISV